MKTGVEICPGVTGFFFPFLFPFSSMDRRRAETRVSGTPSVGATFRRRPRCFSAFYDSERRAAAPAISCGPGGTALPHHRCAVHHRQHADDAGVLPDDCSARHLSRTPPVRGRTSASTTPIWLYVCASRRTAPPPYLSRGKTVGRVGGARANGSSTHGPTADSSVRAEASGRSRESKLEPCWQSARSRRGAHAVRSESSLYVRSTGSAAR